uniref:Ig-like domain-containing protein n=1 Tax=Myripristis murdjan TaxID=586833 RepID=A0A667X6Z9_9TELE
TIKISNCHDLASFSLLSPSQTERKVPPNFTKKPSESMQDSEGKVVKMECRVSGSQPLTITWCKDDREIYSSDKYDISFKNNMAVLCVRDSALSDTGEYTCVAKNAGKEITCTAKLILDVKLLAGLTARAGTKIELPADVKGKPDPRVKWTKADLVLRGDDRITIDTQPGHSKLSIGNTTRGDTATYIIEAVNVCGRATATIDVNILGTESSLLSKHKRP